MANQGNKRAKGCVKLRRCLKFKTHYALQFGLTDRNRKKRLGRHIRHFPEDKAAIALYEAQYGSGTSAGLLANLVSRAFKRANRPSLPPRPRPPPR